MMSVIRPAFGVARSKFLQPRIDRRQILLADMRQHQILFMADADFAHAEAVHQIGERVHLLGAGIARHAADGFQRNRGDGIARRAMRDGRWSSSSRRKSLQRRVGIPSEQVQVSNSGGAK